MWACLWIGQVIPVQSPLPLSCDHPYLFVQSPLLFSCNRPYPKTDTFTCNSYLYLFTGKKSTKNVDNCPAAVLRGGRFVGLEGRMSTKRRSTAFVARESGCVKYGCRCVWDAAQGSK